jgi:hypothetical protein
VWRQHPQRKGNGWQRCATRFHPQRSRNAQLDDFDQMLRRGGILGSFAVREDAGSRSHRPFSAGTSTGTTDFGGFSDLD